MATASAQYKANFTAAATSLKDQILDLVENGKEKDMPHLQELIRTWCNLDYQKALGPYSERTVLLEFNKEWTILLSAASMGRAHVVKALIDIGADPENDEGLDGWTAATVAAANGHVNVLRVLQKAGVDLQKANGNGWSPATIAAREGHAEVIKFLRKAGVDLSASDLVVDGSEGPGYGGITAGSDQTPAQVAAEYGHANVIYALRKTVDLGAITGPNGQTPATIAAEKGHVNIIRALRESKINLEAGDANGMTPATSAALNGRDDVIQELYDAGVDFGKPNGRDQTPVQAARMAGHTKLAGRIEEFVAERSLYEKATRLAVSAAPEYPVYNPV